MTQGPRIGELLVAAGAVTAAEIREALRKQAAGGGLLGRILVEMGACRPEDVLRALGKQMRFTAVDLKRTAPQPEALALLSRDVCRRLRTFPFETLGGWLCAAMVNVLSGKGLNEAERIAGLRLRPFKATHDEIMAAIDRYCPEG